MTSPTNPTPSAVPLTYAPAPRLPDRAVEHALSTNFEVMSGLIMLLSPAYIATTPLGTTLLQVATALWIVMLTLPARHDHARYAIAVAWLLVLWIPASIHAALHFYAWLLIVIGPLHPATPPSAFRIEFLSEWIVFLLLTAQSASLALPMLRRARMSSNHITPEQYPFFP